VKGSKGALGDASTGTFRGVSCRENPPSAVRWLG